MTMSKGRLNNFEKHISAHIEWSQPAMICLSVAKQNLALTTLKISNSPIRIMTPEHRCNTKLFKWISSDQRNRSDAARLECRHAICRYVSPGPRPIRTCQHHLDSTSRRKFIETVIDDSIENGVNTWVLVFHLHSITGCLLLTSSRARGGLVDSPTQTC